MLTFADGLKPSKGRSPAMGLMSPSDGNESINSGLGPMCRNVASLELWMKTQSANSPWDFDPSVILMPWNEVEAQRPANKLKVGVVWDDGVVRCTPPVTVSTNFAH
jgi:amidase